MTHGAKHSKINSVQRKQVVEAMIRQKGWSEKICSDLMAQTGASRKTLYRDRGAVLNRMVEEDKQSIPQRRQEFLAGIRDLRDAAAEDRSWSAAVKLADLEGRIQAIDRVPLPDIEDDIGPVDTSLETLLREVRKLRRQSEAGQSYVAAERLLEREITLVQNIAARDAQIAEREMAGVSPDALVEMIREAWLDLPEPLRAQIRAVVA